MSAVTERPWMPWERNYSGGRVGVRQDGVWTIIHMESGGAVTTTSIREHESWDMALRLSPQLKTRLDELCAESRRQRDALHSLTYREVETDLLRRIAGGLDCGEHCDFSGHRCPKLDRDGCNRADADGIRELAAAIDVANTATQQDVLRAIDSCGGAAPADESADWSRGYNEALEAAEREVKRLFARDAQP